jgi:heme-degrading monooxygenase HmoA
MYLRISWGRLNPGSWDDYEKAFKEGVEAAGAVDGLVARVLSRDMDDPNAGYSITWWESAEAMDAYETGDAVNDEILPRIQPYFAGAFVTNRLQVVMEKQYDSSQTGSVP